MTLRRLFPDPAETTVLDQLAAFSPFESPPGDRPYVITNFALTVDGKATIDGRSGKIGSETDTAMLVGLRTRADAVMIGSGTMRAENYGRVVGDPAKRELRESNGLSPDPLVVILAGGLELPWDAPLFTAGAGEVLIFTASDADPPETATSVGVVRHEGKVDVVEVMHHLRAERGVRAVLCEGGPTLHAELVTAGLVDELFVTRAAKLAGGQGPEIFNGLGARERDLELVWLLEHDGELYLRYRLS
jgi:riboflavin-specific deaminase-like protein